jgi:hypothetical protein
VAVVDSKPTAKREENLRKEQRKGQLKKQCEQEGRGKGLIGGVSVREGGSNKRMQRRPLIKFLIVA